ncbi:hypothetical protein GGR28_003765 [Lewinella aquimaris]|uniref:Uncharacterized protein n=1 Tax=Neolewinella aquimaris TaxID=1835722 RepID=A0A840EGV4_9BACT|nr:hypothetical protein [Neolewinella aquimaris]MBB4081118.1 hypothetical protein [Neolewinella aquimaris]
MNDTDKLIDILKEVHARLGTFEETQAMDKDFIELLYFRAMTSIYPLCLSVIALIIFIFFGEPFLPRIYFTVFCICIFFYRSWLLYHIIKKDPGDSLMKYREYARYAWRRWAVNTQFMWIITLVGWFGVISIANESYGSSYTILLLLLISGCDEIIIMYGFYNPKIIFNRFLMYLSESIYNVSLFVTPIALTATYFSFTTYTVSIIFCVVLLLGLANLVYLYVAKPSASIVASIRYILELANYEKIGMAIGSLEGDIRVSRRVDKDYNDLLESGQYQYLSGMASRVNAQEKKGRFNKGSKFILILGSIFSFIIANIAGPLIQEAAVPPIKNAACKFLSIYCS